MSSLPSELDSPEEAGLATLNVCHAVTGSENRVVRTVRSRPPAPY